MALYERCSGGHVAERVQPVPGSADDERMAALAADPASDWRLVPVEEPAEEPPPPPPPAPAVERPAKNGSKAEWLAYAVDRGLDEADAEKATRDELIVRFSEED